MAPACLGQAIELGLEVAAQCGHLDPHVAGRRKEHVAADGHDLERAWPEQPARDLEVAARGRRLERPKRGRAQGDVARHRSHGDLGIASGRHLDVPGHGLDRDPVGDGRLDLTRGGPVALIAARPSTSMSPLVVSTTRVARRGRSISRSGVDPPSPVERSETLPSPRTTANIPDRSWPSTSRMLTRSESTARIRTSPLRSRIDNNPSAPSGCSSDAPIAVVVRRSGPPQRADRRGRLVGTHLMAGQGLEDLLARPRRDGLPPGGSSTSSASARGPKPSARTRASTRERTVG